MNKDKDLLTRLAAEAIQCRNDGANEVAALLDAAHHTLSSLEPAKRLRLAAGDTVVVKTSQRLTQQQGQMVQDYVASRVPDGVKTLVLDNDFDLLSLEQHHVRSATPLSGEQFANDIEVLIDDLRGAAFDAGAAGDLGNAAMYQAGDAIRYYLFCRSASPEWMKLMVEILTAPRPRPVAEVPQPMAAEVTLPSTADQAELMAKAGMAWLAQHAPERLASAKPISLAAPT